jgi:Flp pilus assembly protein TadD
VGFWRDEVIGFALDRETEKHFEEQRDWIARAPTDPRPWRNLAQLYRMQGRNDEARGLLLECVRLDPAHALAHVDLAEMYAVAGDAAAAWSHARFAEGAGDRRAVELLARHHVAEP